MSDSAILFSSLAHHPSSHIFLFCAFCGRHWIREYEGTKRAKMEKNSRERSQPYVYKARSQLQCHFPYICSPIHAIQRRINRFWGTTRSVHGIRGKSSPFISTLREIGVGPINLKAKRVDQELSGCIHRRVIHFVASVAEKNRSIKNNKGRVARLRTRCIARDFPPCRLQIYVKIPFKPEFLAQVSVKECERARERRGTHEPRTIHKAAGILITGRTRP